MKHNDVKSVYSMILIIKIHSFLNEIQTGKNGVGNSLESEKERVRVERNSLRELEVECR